MEGHIEFRNVGFTYPSRNTPLALSNFSLTIKAGQYVALVGQSGCGKSTLLQLIERFYDPASGSVVVGGRDLVDVDMKQHRKTISLVSQDTVLYSGTIRKNIAMGLPDEEVSDEAILAACRQAYIESFVMSLQ